MSKSHCMIEALGERRMGKSIVHCAACGKAVREEDFSEGKAATIDHRTYCVGCIPADATPTPRPSRRKGSTTRIPLASPGTRRATARSRRTSLLLALLAIGAFVSLFLLFRGDPVAPEKKATQAATQPEAPAAPIASATPPAPPERGDGAATRGSSQGRAGGSSRDPGEAEIAEADDHLSRGGRGLRRARGDPDQRRGVRSAAEG